MHPVPVRSSVCLSLTVRFFLHISYIMRLGKFLEVATRAEHNVWSYALLMPWHVHDIFTSCSRHVYDIFTKCSQHVHNMITTCSRHVHENSRNVHTMFKTFSRTCSPHAHHICSSFYHKFTTCSPHVHHMFTTRWGEGGLIMIINIYLYFQWKFFV